MLHQPSIPSELGAFFPTLPATPPGPPRLPAHARAQTLPVSDWYPSLPCELHEPPDVVNVNPYWIWNVTTHTMAVHKLKTPETVDKYVGQLLGVMEAWRDACVGPAPGMQATWASEPCLALLPRHCPRGA